MLIFLNTIFQKALTMFINEFCRKRLRNRIKRFVENQVFQNFILAVIILNSILLGVMTYPQIMASFLDVMHLIFNICVGIFTVEIVLKLYAYGRKFFKSGWNNFDFIIVLISLVPTAGPFSSFRVFRILRALRALRLITQLDKLRVIVQAIVDSIPNVAWASGLLLIIFYIFSIMGTTLFAADFPDWFGSIGKSMYTLFQVMTLESWSMGIARPVIALHSYAWVYFVSFILVSSFIVMNVIVGVVVNAISEISADIKKEKEAVKIRNHKQDLSTEFMKLKEQMDVVSKLIEAQNNSKTGYMK